MTSIIQECVCVCGPYKSYCGRAEYDVEAGLFHGEVVGTRDVVTFQGKDLPEVQVAFRDSIDDYLKFCKSVGRPPEKPFSGKFVARIDPSLHRKLSTRAQNAGMSLNQYVCSCLEAITEADAAETLRLASFVGPKHGKVFKALKKSSVQKRSVPRQLQRRVAAKKA